MKGWSLSTEIPPFCVPVQMFTENTRLRLAVRECVSEGSQQRHPIEEAQMCRTPAVRRAEAEKRNIASSQIGKSVGPGTFPPNSVVGIPDGSPFGFPAQIVDVPVWVCRGPQMMADPSFQSSRSQGATDVDVEARLHRKLAQPTNLDVLLLRGAEDERVRTGTGSHGVRRKEKRKTPSPGGGRRRLFIGPTVERRRDQATARSPSRCNCGATSSANSRMLRSLSSYGMPP